MAEKEKVLSPNSHTRREALGGATIGAIGAAAAVLGVQSVARAANKSVPRWAMVIDLRRCIGCRGCTTACKAEFDVPLGRFSAVVHQEMVGKYPSTKKMFLPTLCNHCSGEGDNPPPCVKICPEYPGERAKLKTADGKTHRYRQGATYQRPDGAILFDNKNCTGCGKCMEECPYKVRWFNPRIKAGKDTTKNGIGKCTFCMHRVEKGLLPACVNVCEGKARIFGDLDDPDSPVAKLAKEHKLLENRETTTLLPGEKTTPNVFYIDPDGVIAKIYKKGEPFNDEVF